MSKNDNKNSEIFIVSTTHKCVQCRQCDILANGFYSQYDGYKETDYGDADKILRSCPTNGAISVEQLK